ncbi:MAG TPA: hypothetical protein VMY37_14900 [Thermoguttaceae bacterium]|nr:hypothetical protein [Thermoguttaceae bacterium]
MVQDFSSAAPALSTDPIGERKCFGYTSRALTSLDASSANNERVSEEDSRNDFFRALKIVEAESSVRHLRAVNNVLSILPVHVLCPYETWVNVFGEPESVVEYHAPSARLAVKVWKHACLDGPVTCVGHICERFPGAWWVVLVRTTFF